MTTVRENTNKLLGMVEEGLLDADGVLRELLMYLSEDVVSEFVNDSYSDLLESEETKVENNAFNRDKLINAVIDNNSHDDVIEMLREFLAEFYAEDDDKFQHDWQLEMY